MQINSIQQNYRKQQVGFGVNFTVLSEKEYGSACQKTLKAAKEALSKIEGDETVYVFLSKPCIPLRNDRFILLFLACIHLHLQQDLKTLLIK